MLISAPNTNTDIPRIMFSQVSGTPRPRQLTHKINLHTCYLMTSCLKRCMGTGTGLNTFWGFWSSLKYSRGCLLGWVDQSSSHGLSKESWPRHIPALVGLSWWQKYQSFAHQLAWNDTHYLPPPHCPLSLPWFLPHDIFKKAEHYLEPSMASSSTSILHPSPDHFFFLNIRFSDLSFFLSTHCPHPGPSYHDVLLLSCFSFLSVFLVLSVASQHGIHILIGQKELFKLRYLTCYFLINSPQQRFTAQSLQECVLSLHLEINQECECLSIWRVYDLHSYSLHLSLLTYIFYLSTLWIGGPS
jgi:hypothetical protein